MRSEERSEERAVSAADIDDMRKGSEIEAGDVAPSTARVCAVIQSSNNLPSSGWSIRYCQAEQPWSRGKPASPVRIVSRSSDQADQ
jgi:hypothetical protein